MAPAKRGHYPAEFPRESFVQRAIESYFIGQGYQIEQEGYIDLVCRHPETTVRWVIEAKGHTSDVGLDFRTCLGQIVQAMRDPAVCYGVAVPDTPQYRAQCRLVSDWVRAALGLHWLLVATDGTIQIVAPDARLGDPT